MLFPLINAASLYYYTGLVCLLSQQRELFICLESLHRMNFTLVKKVGTVPIMYCVQVPARWIYFRILKCYFPNKSPYHYPTSWTNTNEATVFFPLRKHALQIPRLVFQDHFIILSGRLNEKPIKHNRKKQCFSLFKSIFTLLTNVIFWNGYLNTFTTEVFHYYYEFY